MTKAMCLGGARSKEVRNTSKIRSALKNNASFLLIAMMFIAGSVLAMSFNIPVKSVMNNYSYDVLVILVVMELFTNLWAETGIMQLLAIKIAEMSKGKKGYASRFLAV